jgi:hypothetical protein
VTRIVATLKADNNIGALGKPIDYLALAFIAPLRANDGDICHFYAPSSKGIAGVPVLVNGDNVHQYA